MKAPSPPRPVFLARHGYRSRRMMDLSRLLPVAGLFLFLLPLLHQADGPVSTPATLIYLFSAWFGLIVVAALLARRLARVDDESGTTEAGREGGP